MSFEAMVYQFNTELLGIKDREKGLLSDKEIKYAESAILEELHEFAVAHDIKDYVGAIDAAIDLAYFSVGFLVRLGLNLDEIKGCMKVVHEANMEKKAGIQKKRGGPGVIDATKPDGWVSPEERICEVLDGSHN